MVFHSLRHTSVTYKLKLNGGDIKAVQGDSGHAQVNMVTDVYSHIIDEDRKRNAELFEEAFYGKKNLNPKMDKSAEEKTVRLPEGLDGQSAPNLDNLYALSELLRVPMDLLVAGNRSYKPEANLPTGAIRLLRYYRLLYECMAA